MRCVKRHRLCGRPALRFQASASLAFDQVVGGQDWVRPHHPRTGKPHDGPDPSPHPGSIALDRARGAGRLVFFERTAIQSFQRIVLEFMAIAARRSPGGVDPSAVDANQNPDRLLVPLQAGGWTPLLTFIHGTEGGGQEWSASHFSFLRGAVTSYQFSVPRPTRRPSVHSAVAAGWYELPSGSGSVKP